MAEKKKDASSLDSVITVLQNIDQRLAELNDTLQKIQYGRPQKSSRLLVILLVVVSFFSGYLFLKVKSFEQAGTQPTQETQNVQTQQQQQQQPEQQPQTTISLDTVKSLFKEGYIQFGNPSRKVLFVEISDPSCPFCHIAGGKNPELSKEVNSRFQYVTDGGTYTPPVTEIRKLVDENKASYVMVYGNGHGNGILATQAMYCAFENGKFWEVHDRLMTNDAYNLINNEVKNDKQNIPKLVDFLANEIDSTFLTDCLTSEKYAETLKRDEKIGPQLGFNGTPHFLVNTTIFAGAQDFKDMESAVKTALGEE